MQLFKKYRKRILFAVLLAFLGFMFAREAERVLEYAPALNVDSLDHHDCGVVLTGSAGRVREAFEILAQKKVNRLIISGVYREARLIEIFPLLPYYPEVNPDDVVLEKISGSTSENAVQSLGVVEALRCQDILLITSQLHMSRAYRIFRNTFPATFAISRYPVVNSARDGLWDETFEVTKSVFYSLQNLGPVKL